MAIDCKIWREVCFTKEIMISLYILSDREVYCEYECELFWGLVTARIHDHNRPYGHG